VRNVRCFLFRLVSRRVATTLRLIVDSA